MLEFNDFKFIGLDKTLPDPPEEAKGFDFSFEGSICMTTEANNVLGMDLCKKIGEDIKNRAKKGFNFPCGLYEHKKGVKVRVFDVTLSEQRGREALISIVGEQSIWGIMGQ